MKTMISIFAIVVLTCIGSQAFAEDDPAAANASAAKVARAKAKLKATSKEQNRTDTVVSGSGEGCSSNVNIGNISSEQSINGKVNNEVIITGDVISIAGGNGCGN